MQYSTLGLTLEVLISLISCTIIITSIIYKITITITVHVQTGLTKPGSTTGQKSVKKQKRKDISTKSLNKRHSHAKYYRERKQDMCAINWNPGWLYKPERLQVSHSPERTSSTSARGIRLAIMAAVFRHMPTPAALLAREVAKGVIVEVSRFAREGCYHI